MRLLVGEVMSEAQRRGIWIHAARLVDDLLVVTEPERLDEAVEIVASCALSVLHTELNEEKCKAYVPEMDDADAGADTLEMPFRFYPCLAAGLAYYISMKRAPERTVLLKQIYEEEFERATSQDQDRSSYNIAPDLRSYNSAE